jgi:hypothetical protein
MADKTKPISKSKLPKPFNWSDSLRVAVEKRAYGHAKTGALLARLIGAMPVGGMAFLYHLSQLGFYGEDIWYGYEFFCRSDVAMFHAVVEIEDKNFANFVLDYKAQKALVALRGKE